MKNKSSIGKCRIFAIFFVIVAFSSFLTPAKNASAIDGLPPTPFRIGERLTYSISFERYTDVAYAELTVVSRGKLGDRDAVELRSKIKTLDILNAAFYSLDESRVVFASAETGLPLYVTRTVNSSVTPREYVTDFLNSPSANCDLLTLIYKIRAAGGAGTFSFFENDKIYSLNLTPGPAEAIRVVAGEYNTTLTSAESEFFRENGMNDVKINFTDDSDRIPALIRFRTSKGRFRIELSGLQFKDPKTVEPQITPVATPTPKSGQTPRPIATPTPYIENQQLSEDLAFALGETLDYRLTVAGRPLGTLRLQARERKRFQGHDALMLSAEIISSEPGNPAVAMGDSMTAQVNPESLAPYQLDFRSNGPFRAFSQSVAFENNGTIIAGANRFEAPIGTHSLISLVYALRSFNLKRSTDRSNPVNDTRVSVFWNTKPYVFSLRPADSEIIDIRGQRLSAQMITVNTNDPQLDGLGLKIWLSTDSRRVPLRFSLGSYQADLFAETSVLPK